MINELGKVIRKDYAEFVIFVRCRLLEAITYLATVVIEFEEDCHDTGVFRILESSFDGESINDRDIRGLLKRKEVMYRNAIEFAMTNDQCFERYFEDGKEVEEEAIAQFLQDCMTTWLAVRFYKFPDEEEWAALASRMEKLNGKFPDFLDDEKLNNFIRLSTTTSSLVWADTFPSEEELNS